MTVAEKIWIGPNYSNQRVFVLGESWYGNFTADLATDDGYIRAYLEGHQPDSMYSRMANACMGNDSAQARRDYWLGLMFTNFVQCVGGNRADRPTTEMLKAARPRLAALLEVHKPAGVWILGIGQGEFSAPVVAAAGIPFEVTAHPTSYGLKNAILGASWKTLLVKAKSCVPVR
jgi:hypothetical protein